MKVRRVIGAAHQRAGSDMFEAFLPRDFTQKFELFRRDVFYYWQVLRAGSASQRKLDARWAWRVARQALL